MPGLWCTIPSASFIFLWPSPCSPRFGGGKGAVKEMFRHIAKPAITSLGTCSSVATIPTNMEEAEATGISKDVSEIVVPLGATMHMDGSCFSCILKITFLFGVFGRPFDSIGDMALMVIVAVLSSVGMSGVPGGGYIGEFIMCSVFFPDQRPSPIPSPSPSETWWIPATMINSADDYVVSFFGLPLCRRQGLVPESPGQPERLIFPFAKKDLPQGRSFFRPHSSCSWERRSSRFAFIFLLFICSFNQ